MWEYLLFIKERLASLEGIKSCKIGYEANLSPADYPVIRLVPSSIIPVVNNSYRRKMQVLIYFGINEHESKIGLEELTHKLMAMEQLIREKLVIGRGFKSHYVRTMFDENRLEEPFTVMCVIVDIEGDA